MIPVLATPLLALEAADLVRVEDPHFPGAIARSGTGATLAGPPPPGVRWRPEAVPVPDPVPGVDAGVDVDRIASDGVWAADDGLSVTNADAWHAMGIRGQGVKVAVFDIAWYGGLLDPAELGAVTTHDCHLSSTCEVPMDLRAPTFGFEEGTHGMACAEAVRDFAPDAELHLVRVNSFTTLENAVQWAIRSDIDVISMSMSYYNESFYDGSGPFAPLVEALERADVLLVSSAGNNASTHWAGDWRDGDGDGRLDGTVDNAVFAFDNGASPTFNLTWNQFGRCGETDLDLTILDLEGRILGRAEAAQDPVADRCEPVERVTAAPSADGWYRMEVSHRRGSVVGLKVDLLPRDMSVFEGTAEGSVADPGSHPYTFAVGAVQADGYLLNEAESFSSRGPTNAGVPKPDIAGPDGLSVSVYGPDGFYGTSASTPAVAGLVALVLSSDPSLTPRDAAERLRGWAWGETPSFQRPDPALGPGKARLPVPADGASSCGRRPLIMPVFLLPLWWRMRRRAAARRDLW